MSKRTIEKHIKYNSEEWDIVSKKAAALGQRAGTYIRRISVNGTIKYFDMKQFNHLIMSFNRIGNELNQIAKVANSTNSVFANYLLPIKFLNILKVE